MARIKLSEVFALLPLIAGLISMFGGRKAKKKAKALYPAIAEAVQLWPIVGPKLDALANEDPDIRRFRQLVDSVIAEF